MIWIRNSCGQFEVPAYPISYVTLSEKCDANQVPLCVNECVRSYTTVVWTKIIPIMVPGLRSPPNLRFQPGVGLYDGWHGSYLFRNIFLNMDDVPSAEPQSYTRYRVKGILATSLTLESTNCNFCSRESVWNCLAKSISSCSTRTQT